MRHVLLIGLALVAAACAKVGPQGPAGAPGEACSVEQVENGALITCGAESVIVLDGEDGEDAQSSAYSVRSIEQPCGEGVGEVLFRLENNQLIAHYSQGNKQYLALIGPGNYVTTDGNSCSFSVGPAPDYVLTVQ